MTSLLRRLWKNFLQRLVWAGILALFIGKFWFCVRSSAAIIEFVLLMNGVSLEEKGLLSC